MRRFKEVRGGAFGTGWGRERATPMRGLGLRQRTSCWPRGHRLPSVNSKLELTVTLTAASPLGAVRGIHVGPQEQNALLLCDEVCSIQLAELLQQNRRTVDIGEMQVGEARYSALLRSAHRGAVLGLSCAQSKPILVSAGEDCTIRVRRTLTRSGTRLRHSCRKFLDCLATVQLS